jgi:4-hydroxy-2-oxoheptanedioate aldolase
MRSRINGVGGLALVAIVGCGPDGGARAGDVIRAGDRLNPMIALQERDQPVFGLYAPRARRRGGPASEASDVRSPRQLAEETTAYERSDYVFVSSMERGVERGLPAFTELMSAMHDAGATARTHPLVVKMEKISADPDAVAHIGQQLNAGVSGVMFVGVDTAEEVTIGLDAMRFASNGGTRSDDVGWAPTYWGMTEDEYRAKADLWPLNPAGELINWTIIESHEGLEHVREIAAVPGIGVLWPGAGTLRGLFSTTDPDGQRVVDLDAWEAAILQVLSACKEFNITCGYPASASDVETRMEQGFGVFVMNWGDGGFETIDIGRAAAGR